MAQELSTPAAEVTEPPYTLALAIFTDAVRSYRRCLNGGLAEELRDLELTWRWMQCPERAWPLAFEASCEVFGIDPSHFHHDVDTPFFWVRTGEC